jgi:hypothetical protein
LELRGGGPFVGCTGGQTVFVMRRDMLSLLSV